MSSCYKKVIPSHFKQLLDELNIQRCCGEFCDIVLVVQRMRFSCHKNILSATSRKLKSLISAVKSKNSHKHQRQCDELCINDISPHGFKIILEYIYTGSLWIPEDCLNDITTAANYLEINEVKEACNFFSCNKNVLKESMPGASDSEDDCNSQFEINEANIKDNLAVRQEHHLSTTKFPVLDSSLSGIFNNNSNTSISSNNDFSLKHSNSSYPSTNINKCAGKKVSNLTVYNVNEVEGSLMPERDGNSGQNNACATYPDQDALSEISVQNDEEVMYQVGVSSQETHHRQASSEHNTYHNYVPSIDQTFSPRPLNAKMMASHMTVLPSMLPSQAFFQDSQQLPLESTFYTTPPTAAPSGTQYYTGGYINQSEQINHAGRDLLPTLARQQQNIEDAQSYVNHTLCDAQRVKTENYYQPNTLTVTSNNIYMPSQSVSGYAPNLDYTGNSPVYNEISDLSVERDFQEHSHGPYLVNKLPSQQVQENNHQSEINGVNIVKPYLKTFDKPPDVSDANNKLEVTTTANYNCISPVSSENKKETRHPFIEAISPYNPDIEIHTCMPNVSNQETEVPSLIKDTNNFTTFSGHPDNVPPLGNKPESTNDKLSLPSINNTDIYEKPLKSPTNINNRNAKSLNTHFSNRPAARMPPKKAGYRGFDSDYNRNYNAFSTQFTSPSNETKSFESKDSKFLDKKQHNTDEANQDKKNSITNDNNSTAKQQNKPMIHEEHQAKVNPSTVSDAKKSSVNTSFNENIVKKTLPTYVTIEGKNNSGLLIQTKKMAASQAAKAAFQANKAPMLVSVPEKVANNASQKAGISSESYSNQNIVKSANTPSVSTKESTSIGVKSSTYNIIPATGTISTEQSSSDGMTSVYSVAALKSKSGTGSENLKKVDIETNQIKNEPENLKKHYFKTCQAGSVRSNLNTQSINNIQEMPRCNSNVKKTIHVETMNTGMVQISSDANDSAPIPRSGFTTLGDTESDLQNVNDNVVKSATQGLTPTKTNHMADLVDSYIEDYLKFIDQSPTKISNLQSMGSCGIQNTSNANLQVQHANLAPNQHPLQGGSQYEMYQHHVNEHNPTFPINGGAHNTNICVANAIPYNSQVNIVNSGCYTVEDMRKTILNVLNQESFDDESRSVNDSKDAHSADKNLVTSRFCSQESLPLTTLLKIVPFDKTRPLPDDLDSNTVHTDTVPNSINLTQYTDISSSQENHLYVGTKCGVVNEPDISNPDIDHEDIVHQFEDIDSASDNDSNYKLVIDFDNEIHEDDKNHTYETDNCLPNHGNQILKEKTFKKVKCANSPQSQASVSCDVAHGHSNLPQLVNSKFKTKNGCKKKKLPFKIPKYTLTAEYREDSESRVLSNRVVKSGLIETVNEEAQIVKPLKKRIKVKLLMKKAQDDDFARTRATLKKKVPKRPIKHTCELCSREFFDNSMLYAKHMQHHAVNQLHFCNVCGMGYKRIEDLSKHRTSNHGLHSFQCRNCYKIFDSSVVYKKHCVEEHKDLKPFYCLYEKCKYSSEKFNILEKHMLIHGKVKQFSCPQCNQEFSQPNGLRAHILSCMNMQTYICHVCAKTFNRQQGLKDHLLCHNATRSNVCKDCGASFNDVRNYKRHCRIHTNELKFACKHCDLRFNYSHVLKRHIVKKHPDKQTIEFGRKGAKNKESVLIKNYI